MEMEKIPNSEISNELKLNIDAFLSRQRKILIVEDDQNRIKWFYKYIAPGHQVTIAKDGESALSVLKNDSKWDLIFLDHDLRPDHIMAAKTIQTNQEYINWQQNYNGYVTGLDIAVWLSNNKETRNIPVLIHSMNPQGSNAIKFVLSEVSFQTPFEEFKSIF